jgi:hypothetical protein
MTETILIALLAIAVVLGSLRLLATHRSQRWGMSLAWRMLLQPLLAVLLYLTLFPPHRDAHSVLPLIVLTSQWQHADLASPLDPARTVALPEAEDADHYPQAPDLASALRLHPRHADLHILGAGLGPRDSDAARGRVSAFNAAPLARGITDLQIPAGIRPGQQITLAGRVHEVDGGSLNLLDPRGQPLARAPLGSNGNFSLEFIARGHGPSLLGLELTDADGVQVESLQVPLVTTAADQPRVLLLSGAPSPELKYLRRWAVDAGVELTSRVQLTERIPQRRGEPALDHAALQSFDLVILDERAWRELGAGDRETLIDAVRAGLGLLLRITDNPAPADRQALQTLGFDVEATDIIRSVRLDIGGTRANGIDAANVPSPSLDSAPASASSSAPSDARPVLTRRPLAVTAIDGVPLLATDDGDPLALWRAHGQGRIALWWLSDSYRLVLTGTAAQHGTLWSNAVSTLARPGEPGSLQVASSDSRVGERVMICRVGNADNHIRATAPDASTTHLLFDGRGGCAGYWPSAAGFHRIDVHDAAPLWLYVRDEASAPGLAAAQSQHITQTLLEEARQTLATDLPAQQRARPWSFLIGWVLLFALLGWIERRNPAR